MKELSNAQMLKVKLAERKLFQHLEYGGKIDDQMGTTILNRFLDKVSQIDNIVEIVQKYGDNVASKELAHLIVAINKNLMPNPTINCGGQPLLVSTLIFMEIHRLDEILENLFHKLPKLSPGLSSDDFESLAVERLTIINQQAKKVSDIIYDTHKSMVGETNFEIKELGGSPTAGGCATMFIISGALVYLTNQIIEII